MKNLFLSLSLLLTFSSISPDLLAQTAPKPRKSPLAIAQLKSGKTYVRVVYSQPHKNERLVFGGLVAYDKVWRLGANEATEITITHKIKMGGQTIAPGTYSMFAIPSTDKWTIILNKDLGMWGEYDYKAANDLVRFVVAVKPTEQSWEAFTIRFDKQSNQQASMTLVWDKTSVEIPIEILK